MRIIELHKVRSDSFRSPYSDTDDVGEAQQQGGPETQTDPTCIDADHIRCFYPRKNNRPGTRITFKDGGGFAVSEPYDEVKAMVTPN